MADRPQPPTPEQEPDGPQGQPRWLQIASVGLFVVLAVYVSVSGVRLALLLWQRFGAG
ncbi:MAG: hypothetical protein ACO23C_10410 [Prochlorococcaceae cyanobacterium]|jgi:hypothetical protein